MYQRCASAGIWLLLAPGFRDCTLLLGFWIGRTITLGEIPSANGLVAEKNQQKVFEILQREIQQSLESRCDEQTEGAPSPR